VTNTKGAWRDKYLVGICERGEYWLPVHFEYLIELGCLQCEGKIVRLRYRREKRTGLYIVHFIRTALLNDQFDLFNFIEEYSPDQYEDRRKWFLWK